MARLIVSLNILTDNHADDGRQNPAGVGYPMAAPPEFGNPNFQNNKYQGYPNSNPAAYPNAGYPNSGYPNAGYPNADYPNAGYPNAGYPNAGYPMSVAQNHLRQNAAGNMEKFDGVSESNHESGFLDNFSKLKGDEDRQNFVTKVFSIMTVQVIATALFTYFIISDKSRMKFCVDNMWLYIV